MDENTPGHINYVTYLENGDLDGGFYQIIPIEHMYCHILVTEQQRRYWPNYRANAARDGVELINPPVPVEPPVDPEPEPPVQSEPPTNP